MALLINSYHKIVQQFVWDAHMYAQLLSPHIIIKCTRWSANSQAFLNCLWKPVNICSTYVVKKYPSRGWFLCFENDSNCLSINSGNISYWIKLCINSIKVFNETSFDYSHHPNCYNFLTTRIKVPRNWSLFDIEGKYAIKDRNACFFQGNILLWNFIITF